MANTSDDRTTLEKDLANLLEYDDASDEITEILDNLLHSFFPDRGTSTHKKNNVTSTNDLLEHMVAWLGDGGDAVQLFVANVVRFEGGESILRVDASSSSHPAKNGSDVTSGRADAYVRGSSTIQQSAGQWNNNNKTKTVKSNRQKQKEQNNQKQKESQQKKEELRRSQQKQEQKRTEERQRQRRLEEDNRKQNRETEELLIQNERKLEEQRKMKLEAVANAKRRELQEAKDRIPPPPPRGQATVICGCFGTKCKPLTNCLHCGRIACEKEGYGYCPFCTYLIQQHISQRLSNVASGAGTPMEKAIRHKERLLEFDRECAKRTIVLDDQADYFKNSSSTWLSGDERQQAAELDDTRRRGLHQRKKPVMKLDIVG